MGAVVVLRKDKNMSKKQKFPNQLFVSAESDGPDSFYLANEKVEDFQVDVHYKRKIATYKLDKVEEYEAVYKGAPTSNDDD